MHSAAAPVGTARKLFAERFGAQPSVASAPARVNIIGEHTDYNAGLVLPTTTALYTVVAWAPRDDDQIVVHSAAADDTYAFSAGNPASGQGPDWTQYVRGTALELGSAGVRLRGANLLIVGNIPIGGGLSSSASLELAVAHALLAAAGDTIDAVRMARLCQRAESETVGLQCGIMDQLAIAACHRGSAMLIDCRTEDYEFVQVPDAARLLLIDTGVKHRLPEGEYNTRRAECEQALETLRSRYPHLTSICDLNLSELSACSGELGTTLFKRCQHVVSENQRVAEAVRALRQRDLHTLGRLMSESHESLCVDFEVSCDESDALVERLARTEGVLGARQVGAGFGGCVLALVSHHDAEDIARKIAQRSHDGEPHWWHVVAPADPAGARPAADATIGRTAGVN